MNNTRAVIITEALGQVGRSDLASQARLWLNLFLEKIYKTQDWPWLIKSSGEVALTEGGSLPSDYWKMKAANLLIDSRVVSPMIVISDAAEYATRLQVESPLRVYIDETNRVFKFIGMPDGSSYTWEYWYYYLPTLPNHTDAATDTQVPVWGLHDEILIRAVQLKALYYNDDKRYNEGIQELMQEIVQGKMNSFDFRAGHNRIKLGKSFRRRF
jgi:hypothetical protein